LSRVGRSGRFSSTVVSVIGFPAILRFLVWGFVFTVFFSVAVFSFPFCDILLVRIVAVVSVNVGGAPRPIPVSAPSLVGASSRSVPVSEWLQRV
jgi:hypothetical protein